MQSGHTSLSAAEEIVQSGRSSIFAELPVDAVARLIGSAVVRRYPRNTLLFSQGDTADHFFVVLSGKVKLFTATEDGDQSVLDIFGAGFSFAEAAIFASGRFPVNAEVVEASRLVPVPADHFLRQLAAAPDLGFKILAMLSRHHQRLVHQIGDLKLKSPGQRLGGFLLALCEADDGPGAVRLPFDKSLVAARIGIKPESLSRAFARLREIGVDCRGRDVAIAEIAQLRAFCEEGETDSE